MVLALRDYTTTAVTYNLTIDGLHTYYVEAGSAPVLVHNSTCDEAVLDSEGEAYVKSKHMAGGTLVDGTKGLFTSDVDLYQLAEDSNSV